MDVFVVENLLSRHNGLQSGSGIDVLEWIKKRHAGIKAMVFTRSPMSTILTAANVPGIE